MLRPFSDAQANGWVIHSFMRRQRDELGGKPPADVILDGTVSVAAVVVRDLVREQGAL